MGSDNHSQIQEKSSTHSWSKIKIVLTILTSFALVARIAVSDSIKFSSKGKNDAANKKQAMPTPPAPVAKVRPAADSPDYDPYFVSVAPDFVVGSDFDVGKVLHKQGFRVTKDKAKDMLKRQIKGSLSEEFLTSHHGLLSADWASQGVEAVPLLHHTVLDFDKTPANSFPDKAALEAKIQAFKDHEFVLDVSSVVTPRMTTTSNEKYIFMYDNHTWNMDSMNPIKFINLLEFFAERTFHGAFMKETVEYKQTAMQPMMPQDEIVDSDIKQSFALMPRYFSPKVLRDTCHAEASGITENLDQPIELKVLVLWGKAYMATCYASICNPFVGTAYTPAQGPRYVIYPDGKSTFLEGEPESPGDQKCAQAVDSYIKNKLQKAMETAEKVARTIGAPWLRVDLFLDDKAKTGSFLHRVKSADVAVSGWVKRSERAMAVVARGFEGRAKVRGPHQPKSLPSADNLKALGCIVSPNDSSMQPLLRCQSKSAVTKNATLPLSKSSGNKKA